MNSSKKRRDTTHRCPVCHWVSIEEDQITELTKLFYCTHCGTIFSEDTYTTYIKNKHLNQLGTTKE